MLSKHCYHVIIESFTNSVIPCHSCFHLCKRDLHLQTMSNQPSTNTLHKSFEVYHVKFKQQLSFQITSQICKQISVNTKKYWSRHKKKHRPKPSPNEPHAQNPKLSQMGAEVKSHEYGSKPMEPPSVHPPKSCWDSHTYIHTLHYIALHYITLPYLPLHYLTLHYIHTYVYIYIHLYECINIYIY